MGNLKYYPLTRIRTNLYTRGNEFVNSKGVPYAGRYYSTYNGKSYTGINPALGQNDPLTPIAEVPQQSNREANTPNNVAYTAATNQTNTDAELVELTNYYPTPLNSDYARGYFTRYFAKNVSGPGFVLEISKLDWTKIQNGNVAANALGYQTMDMLWQLTGPLNDKRISQYQIQGGIIETNTRVTVAKNKGFNGIVAYIGGEYTKYSKPTP